MALTCTRLSYTLDGTTSITVSDIVQDPVDGAWVRLIQIYIDPPTLVNRRPVLELTVRGDTQDTVEIQTPRLEF